MSTIAEGSIEQHIVEQQRPRLQQNHKELKRPVVQQSSEEQQRPRVQQNHRELKRPVVQQNSGERQEYARSAIGLAGVSRQLSEVLFIWGVGGCLYYGLELALRGFSHWSMFVLGGLALAFCTFQGQAMHWAEPLWLQVLRAVLFVTALEFATGIIVNKWLQLAVWDYSDQPLNLWGQICVPFMILFAGLIALAIPLGGSLTSLLYRRQKPWYHVL